MAGLTNIVQKITPPFLIKVINSEIIVCDPERKEYRLPSAGIFRISGEKAFEYAPHWKRIHTFAEKLLSKYILFLHSLIQRIQYESNLKIIPYSDINNNPELLLNSFIKEVVDCIDQIITIKKFPESFCQTQPLLFIQDLLVYCNAIKSNLPIIHSLATSSEEFQNYFKLIHGIEDCLFGVLHAVDLQLEIFLNDRKTLRLSWWRFWFLARLLNLWLFSGIFFMLLLCLIF